MIHPIEITLRRPTRSDQLPAIIDVAALTAFRAAHTKGIARTVPAAFVSLSSRNASVEFPNVKIERTTMKRANDGGRGADFTVGPVVVSVRVTPDTPPVCASGSRMRRIKMMAITPGMIVRANNVRDR